MQGIDLRSGCCGHLNWEYHAQANCWIDLGLWRRWAFYSKRTGAGITSAQIEVFVGKTIKQVDDRYWAFYEPGGKLGGLYVNDEDQGRWIFLVDCANDGIVGMRTSRLASMFEGTGRAYRLDDGAGNGFNVTVRAGNPMGLL